MDKKNPKNSRGTATLVTLILYVYTISAVYSFDLVLSERLSPGQRSSLTQLCLL